jgi:hypothetical protein
MGAGAPTPSSGHPTSCLTAPFFFFCCAAARARTPPARAARAPTAPRANYLDHIQRCPLVRVTSRCSGTNPNKCSSGRRRAAWRRRRRLCGERTPLLPPPTSGMVCTHWNVNDPVGNLTELHIECQVKDPVEVSKWSCLSTAGGTPPLGYPAGRVVTPASPSVETSH